MAEKTEGRAVGVRVVLPAFLALVLVFMGAALIMRGFSLLTHPLYVEDVYWTDVQDGDVVCAEDISLIQPLLYTDSAMGKTACCLVSYRDAGGDMCVGVLRASAADGLYGFIEEYINDGDASLGGYAVKGYFTARSIDGFGARFGAEYAAACENRCQGFAVGRISQHERSQKIGDLRALHRHCKDHSYQNYCRDSKVDKKCLSVIHHIFHIKITANCAYKLAIAVVYRRICRAEPAPLSV